MLSEPASLGAWGEAAEESKIKQRPKVKREAALLLVTHSACAPSTSICLRYINVCLSLRSNISSIQHHSVLIIDGVSILNAGFK